MQGRKVLNYGKGCDFALKIKTRNKQGDISMKKLIENTVQYFGKKLSGLLFCMIATVIITGCATSEVVSRNKVVHEKLERPSKIFVYNFIANPADIPKGASEIVTKTAKESPKMSSKDIAIGRRLGRSIASNLVKEINDIGLRAETANSNSKPKVNDIVLRGYIVSLSEGNATKRVVIGFGYGSAKLESVVEGYQMTNNGLRKLGTAKFQSDGSKSPGGGVGATSMIANANPVGLIVGGIVKGYGELSGSSKIEGLGKVTAEEIAKQLKIRFKEENWIK